MSVRSPHRRLVAGLIAGLAVTLAPALGLSSASAAEAPVTALRVDNSIPAAVGSINITWNAPTAGDYGGYFIETQYADGFTEFDIQPLSDLTYKVTGVDPGEAVDITVTPTPTGCSDCGGGPEANLRVTGLDDVALSPNFTDTRFNFFRYEISWLASAGVTTGYDGVNNTRFFAPSQPVLREQMAAFLYRYAGSPAVKLPATSPFVDVPTNATFYKEIVWLAQEGISTGYVETNGAKTFRPSQPVLREQMAAFLYRFDGTDFQAESGSFRDVPASAIFFDEIQWLANEGISTGYDEADDSKTFRGSQAVLREQMAAFLYRYETGPFGQNGELR